MAKKSNKKVVSVKKSKKKLAPTTTRQSATTKVARTPDELIFGRQNYLWMLGGAVLIALGLVTMIGGSMPDANTWDPNIIYSKRITFVAPMLILAGLIVEIVAIFKK